VHGVGREGGGGGEECSGVGEDAQDAGAWGAARGG
jgi:hypothetical protein